MQFVYLLRSLKDGTLYTGCTADLKARFALHNAGKVSTTKTKIPLQILYYEAYIHKQDAYAGEKFLKTGWGRNYLKKTLRNALQEQKN